MPNESYEDQVNAMKTRARAALRRAHIDKTSSMGMALKKVGISPLAIDASFYEGTEVERKDAMLTYLPALLDIAIWAHYYFKDEESPNV